MARALYGSDGARLNPHSKLRWSQAWKSRISSVGRALPATAAAGRRLPLGQRLGVVWVIEVPAAGACAALVTILLGRVQAVDVELFLVGFVLTGLGITVGYHRLATHQSFETYPFVKAILLALGSMAVEGPVVSWVANHRQHHANTDRPHDPHSPRDGFLHAHWGWLFQTPEAGAQAYATQARRDRVTALISATFPIWMLAGYVIPFLIAGWEGFIWGGLFRQFAVQQVTFAVNSFCHRYGSKPFPTGNLSTNNWVVGILGLGEGWHNNHHAFPWSAYQGLRWWQLDLSAYVIHGLELVGLAWNVKRPSQGQIQARAARDGGA